MFNFNFFKNKRNFSAYQKNILSKIAVFSFFIIVTSIFLLSISPTNLQAQGEDEPGWWSEAMDRLTFWSSEVEEEDEYLCLDYRWGFFPKINFNYCITWIAAYAGSAVLTISSIIVIISGFVFDYVMNYTVVDLSSNLLNSSGGIQGAIQTVWETLRDLANILFIFILLYISIKTILGSADTKKLLKNVIIIALLINFSLFFTKVVIEVSNSLAVSFYNASVSTDIAEEEDGSISGAFLKATGVATTEDEATSEILVEQAQGSIIGVIGLIFVRLILFVILSFILFVASILFITRYVMFIFLMILSPLAFVSSIVPISNEQFKKWFKSLSHYALFAPVFLMLIWASLVILNEAGTADPDVIIEVSDGETEVGEGSDVGETIFTIFFGSGFLIASLIIAKSLSLSGAEQMSNFGSKYGKMAIGAGTAGLAARSVRRPAGYIGQKISDSERVRNLKNSNYGVLRGVGNMAQSGGEKMAKSSFDVRATGALSGYGTAISGGYKDLKDRKSEKVVTQAKKQAPSSAVIGRAERELKEAATEQERIEKQNRLDELKGVSEGEAKKRKEEIRKRAEQKIRKKTGKYVEKIPTSDWEKIVNDETKKIVKKEKININPIESLGDKRTKSYIEKRTKPIGIKVPEKVPYVGGKGFRITNRDALKKDTWDKYEASKKKKKDDE